MNTCRNVDIEENETHAKEIERRICANNRWGTDNCSTSFTWFESKNADRDKRNSKSNTILVTRTITENNDVVLNAQYFFH